MVSNAMPKSAICHFTTPPADFEAALDRKLDLAAEAFAGYRRTSVSNRAAILLRAARILEAEVEECASITTSKMSKTVASARNVLRLLVPLIAAGEQMQEGLDTIDAGLDAGTEANTAACAGERVRQ